MEDEGRVDPPLPGSGGTAAAGGPNAAKAGDPKPDEDDTVAFQQPESAAAGSGQPEGVDPELPGSGG
jgi:hypothetical protein